MIAVDSLYAAFITALDGFSPVRDIVEGGWRQGRHEQGASDDGPYGIILLTPSRVEQSSSFITKYYTLTLSVYMPASATVQASLQSELAALLDYKPGAIGSITGGAVNMISPVQVDQRVERQMRSGTDVVPVVCQWLVRTVETRA